MKHSNFGETKFKKMTKNIFVNLPIKDMEQSQNFFSNLGYTFNPQFTNDQGACLVLGENIFVMLLVESYFQTFIDKKICNTKTTTEVLLAISAESKDEVDTMMERVSESGGKVNDKIQDYGWMYSRSFEDLDGHIWEVVYVNMSEVPQE